MRAVSADDPHIQDGIIRMQGEQTRQQCEHKLTFNETKLMLVSCLIVKNGRTASVKEYVIDDYKYCVC